MARGIRIALVGGMSELRIAVMGCGKVGRALGAWAAQRGHRVFFCSRRLESAESAAREAGKDARAGRLDAALAESELILLTTPFDGVALSLEPSRQHLAGKILVDVTNPITPDHRALRIGFSDSGAEQIARNFPEARVVKAFNAVFAEVYAARTPELRGVPISICYAGDDDNAKERVRLLIASLGFDAVDAGPLVNSRYLEPLSLLNIQLGRELGYGTQIGFALTRADHKV